MSHAKQAGKGARTDPNAAQPPPRLSQTLVEWWFEEEDELTDFDDRLSKMEILPPKYIGDGVLSDAKYSEFWRLIDIQGLRPFLYMRGRYYPHFVAAASTTIFIRENEDEGEEFTLGFCLGGREFKFTLDALAAAWGLRNEGDTFKGGNHPLVSSYPRFTSLDAHTRLSLAVKNLNPYLDAKLNAHTRCSSRHRASKYTIYAIPILGTSSTYTFTINGLERLTGIASYALGMLEHHLEHKFLEICKVIKLKLSRNLRAKNGVENSQPIPSKWYRIEKDGASFV
ncbi:hypothetical protein PIB30_071408 [Stylosanthes scabra]|uniref:Uncharacterized protein n=1 Tax=Stylosanthes scabra TaxID=79078 RepID=A0ABU6XNQ1_9FABA|nr:hypothetical protein [Stylosanthes scabra]